MLPYHLKKEADCLKCSIFRKACFISTYVIGVEYSLLKHTAIILDNYLAHFSIWVLVIHNCLRAEEMFPLRRLNKEFIDISEDWLKKTLLNKRSFI